LHLSLIAGRPVKSVPDPAAPPANADGAAPVQPAHLGGQPVRRGFANAADGWTLRRLVAVAVLFPLLLALSYFGKFSRPRWGAGVLAVAQRPLATASSASGKVA